MAEVKITLPDSLDYTSIIEAYKLPVEEIQREVRDCIMSELVGAVRTVVKQLIYQDEEVKAKFLALVKEKLVALEDTERRKQSALNIGLILPE